MKDYKTISDVIANQPVPTIPPHVRFTSTDLRDQFAMAALTGMCADPELTSLCDRVAKHAYLLADAMMEARK